MGATLVDIILQSKILTGSDIPTIPSTIVFDDWLQTDIAKGSFAINIDSNRVWTRTESGILELSNFSLPGIWVRKDIGDDTTGDGTFALPFKTIRHAVLNCPASTTIYVVSDDYQEDCLTFSDGPVADNITLMTVGSCILRGPARTNVTQGALPGPKKLIFHNNTAVTFNIVGNWNIRGDYGFLSVENSGAKINADVETFSLDTTTGSFNIRAKIGEINLVVRNDDMRLATSQGLFVGPGDGSLDLTVVNGDIIFARDTGTHTSDQTRFSQILNASTSRPTRIKAKGIKMQNNGGHTFTLFGDGFFINSPGTRVFIDLEGEMQSLFIPYDNDAFKQYGQDGMLILLAGIVNFKGDIRTAFENCISTYPGGNIELYMDGKLYCDKKHAVRHYNTSSGTIIEINNDRIKSGGGLPTIEHNGGGKMFLDAPIKNTNSNQGNVGINYNGTGLILKNDFGAQCAANHCFTTRSAGRTFKMYKNIPINKAIGSAIGRKERVTINKVRPNQVYSITVNGTAYTYNSGGSPTNLTISAGLVSAIGTPAGVAAVVDTFGAFTVEATAGTDLVLSDSSTWGTHILWEFVNSVNGNTFGLTLDGVNFSYTPTGATYYNENSPNGLTDIFQQVRAAVQANAGVNAKILSISQFQYGFIVETNTNAALTYAPFSDDVCYVPTDHKNLTFDVLEFGMVAVPTNQITALPTPVFLEDALIEF